MTLPMVDAMPSNEDKIIQDALAARGLPADALSKLTRTDIQEILGKLPDDVRDDLNAGTLDIADPDLISAVVDHVQRQLGIVIPNAQNFTNMQNQLIFGRGKTI